MDMFIGMFVVIISMCSIKLYILSVYNFQFLIMLR